MRPRKILSKSVNLVMFSSKINVFFRTSIAPLQIFFGPPLLPSIFFSAPLWYFCVLGTVFRSDFWDFCVLVTVFRSEFWYFCVLVTVFRSDFWHFCVLVTVFRSDFWYFSIFAETAPTALERGERAPRHHLMGKRPLRCRAGIYPPAFFSPGLADPIPPYDGGGGRRGNTTTTR